MFYSANVAMEYCRELRTKALLDMSSSAKHSALLKMIDIN